MLDDLISGGDRQQQYGDFVNRYQQGGPHEGISDEETGQRYAEVAGEVNPQNSSTPRPRAKAWTPAGTASRPTRRRWSP